MDNLTEALKEAYASNPLKTVILDTLEINHTSFDGPIRLVNDHQNLLATLEKNAPFEGGEKVVFNSYPFRIVLPNIHNRAMPEILITIDNVSRLLSRNLEKAISTREVINLIYRPYLSDDTSQPQYDPPLYLTLTDISMDIYKMTAKARFVDLTNKKFPNEKYTLKRFPTLQI